MCAVVYSEHGMHECVKRLMCDGKVIHDVGPPETALTGKINERFYIITPTHTQHLKRVQFVILTSLLYITYNYG